MSKVKKQTAKAKKEAQTIKVKTLVISVVVIITIIASFVGGIFTANAYNSNLEKQIEIRAKQITALKENQ